MRRKRLVVVLMAFGLVAAACGRDDETETAGDTATTAADDSTSSSEPDADGDDSEGGLGAGDFGTLTGLCGESDLVPSDAPGVTDTEINIGVLTDRGAEVRPGLNEEMYDTVIAFADWCNENGGIAGRQIKVNDRDAKLFEYNAAIQAACAEDFMLVGGGAVFDDADNGGRIECGLPSIAGFVVTNSSRDAELQVQPVPNPPGAVGIGHLQAALDAASAPNFGVLVSDIPAPLEVADGSQAAAEDLGATLAYRASYGVGGEDNWVPFINDMQQASVTILNFVGEPDNLTGLLKAMQQAEWYPEFFVLETNFYEENLIAEAGDALQNVFVRSVFHPRELASDNPPTRAFLDLMAGHNPGGKVATLGQHALSASLLFAASVNECTDELTRACVIDAAAVDEWTGGGTHAPTDPGANQPSSCLVILEATPDGFVVDEGLTDANDGIFNCDPSNMAIVES